MKNDMIFDKIKMKLKLKLKNSLTKRFLPMMMFMGVGLLMSLSSCELESSDNGDLDGFWHLERIDSLDTGKSVDMSKLHVFWGVEHKLIAARQNDMGKESFYFRFEHTSDSLMITKVYANHGHQDRGDDGGDIPLDDVTEDLKYYGVNAIPEGFLKESLSGSKMVLKSKVVRLWFKKF